MASIEQLTAEVPAALCQELTAQISSKTDAIKTEQEYIEEDEDIMETISC